MEGQALISKKEYNTVKTMYVLAIFFCVLYFIYPLTYVLNVYASFNPDYAAQNPEYFWQVALIYPNTLLLNPQVLFLLFCLLLAKGRARKTLIFIAILACALIPVINNVINSVNYYTQVYPSMNDPQQIANRQAMGLAVNTYPLIDLNRISNYLTCFIYVVLAIAFIKKYKAKENKPAAVSFIYALIALWAVFFILKKLWPIQQWNILQNISQEPFILWVLFVIAIGLLCWIVRQQIRPVPNKYAPVLSAVFILFIAIYTICVSFPFSSDAIYSVTDVLSSILVFLQSLMPLYIMIFAYKAVSDYSFYKLFVESNPRGIIRSKQFTPGDDSVWNQFVSLMRRAFLKKSS